VKQSFVEQKNICEIRSTSKKVLLSRSDPPKVSTALDFRQFYSLTGNISATDWDIKNWYSKWSTTTPRLLGKKFGEHWSTNKKVSLSHFNLP